MLKDVHYIAVSLTLPPDVPFIAKCREPFQVTHVDIFPTKMSLQLKIREVRQKLMAQTNLTPHSEVNTPTSKSPQLSKPTFNQAYTYS